MKYRRKRILGFTVSASHAEGQYRHVRIYVSRYETGSALQDLDDMLRRDNGEYYTERLEAVKTANHERGEYDNDSEYLTHGFGARNPEVTLSFQADRDT